MRDGVKVSLAVVFVLALISGGIALSCAHYRECRRIHPWWYCAEQGGH